MKIIGCIPYIVSATGISPAPRTNTCVPSDLGICCSNNLCVDTCIAAFSDNSIGEATARLLCSRFSNVSCDPSARANITASVTTTTLTDDCGKPAIKFNVTFTLNYR